MLNMISAEAEKVWEQLDQNINEYNVDDTVDS